MMVTRDQMVVFGNDKREKESSREARRGIGKPRTGADVGLLGVGAKGARPLLGT